MPLPMLTIQASTPNQSVKLKTARESASFRISTRSIESGTPGSHSGGQRRRVCNPNAPRAKYWLSELLYPCGRHAIGEGSRTWLDRSRRRGSPPRGRAA